MYSPCNSKTMKKTQQKKSITSKLKKHQEATNFKLQGPRRKILTNNGGWSFVLSYPSPSCSGWKLLKNMDGTSKASVPPILPFGAIFQVNHVTLWEGNITS